ncbi:triosephosphate isomerase [Xylariaceae sp. FL1651]|nr:triosephosphate isomerase [Xylariaceae sp. FL1651]
MSSSISPPRRRRLVGVSTKMYFSFARTTSYMDALVSALSQLSPDLLASLRDTDIFVIPDHVSLTSVIAQLRRAPVPVLAGAQDAFHEDAGAFTGEVSPAVLAEVGCRVLELGHAERRRLFGETDESAARKAAAAARNGIVPLVCVGERTKPPALSSSSPPAFTPTAVSPHDSSSQNDVDDDHDHDDYDKNLDVPSALPEIRTQVEAVLSAVPPTADVILAYEPVWAIGAAAPAGASYVVAVAQAIREFACVRGRPGTTRILYGGSAGPGLFGKLKDGVDGLFLGRFAHDPEQFVKTICEVATA